MRYKLYRNRCKKYFILFLFCIVIISCKQVQLIGKWQRAMPLPKKQLQTFIFNADSSFVISIYPQEAQMTVMGLKIGGDTKGTWRIVDHFLLTDIDKSEPVAIGPLKILNLTKKKLVLIDSITKERLVYTRL